MKRFFNYLYIKEGTTPFDTIALTALNGVDWKKLELRSKSKVDTAPDGESEMGDGTKKVNGEKTDFESGFDLTPEDYATLRTFKNKRVTLVLLDADNPDSNGDFLACPAIFGIRVYPKKSIVSGEDSTITLTGGISAKELETIQRDITVTN